MDEQSEALMKLASFKTLKRETHELFEFCELRCVAIPEVDKWFDVCEARLKSFIKDKTPEWTEEGKKQVEAVRQELEEDMKEKWVRLWVRLRNTPNDEVSAETYMLMPKRFDNDDMKDEAEHWAQQKYHWVERYEYGFEEVDTPPDKWLEERVNSHKESLRKLGWAVARKAEKR